MSVERSRIAAFAMRGIQASLVAGLASSACSSGGGGGPGPGVTGTACTQASQCYPGLVSDAGDAGGAIRGTPACLSLQNGYCTHTCTADTDCCAVPGECPLGFNEICASFESSGQMYCFLSCSAADVAAAHGTTTDPSTYCQTYANATFTCRSTGGGSANAKFCGP
jgi:hypothetical protein